jgi:hypothetical protein
VITNCCCCCHSCYIKLFHGLHHINVEQLGGPYPLYMSCWGLGCKTIHSWMRLGQDWHTQLQNHQYIQTSYRAHLRIPHRHLYLDSIIGT